MRNSKKYKNKEKLHTKNMDKNRQQFFAACFCQTESDNLF